MRIEATKTSFYEGEHQHLKFIETTDTKECSHFGCNCTKTVSEKPTTRLTSVQNSVDLYLKRGKYDISICLNNGAYTFRWDDKHAYFWMKYVDFYKCWAEKGIQISISKNEWTPEDYFQSIMFLGPHVNISTLMNGHCPSRVVDLTKIKTDDIWIHGCGDRGKESIRTLSNHDESDNWRRVIETSANISNLIVHRFKPEAEYTVFEIKDAVSKQKNLEESINFCVDFFIKVLDNLESTELFKLTKEINEDIYGRSTSSI